MALPQGSGFPLYLFMLNIFQYLMKHNQFSIKRMPLQSLTQIQTSQVFKTCEVFKNKMSKNRSKNPFPFFRESGF